MESEKELQPCPFCGNGAAISGGERDGFYVTCLGPDCFCVLGEAYDSQCMPDHSFPTEEAAVKAWNKRVTISYEKPQVSDEEE